MLKSYLCVFRDGVSDQEMESQIEYQKSTGALISDKDGELETLRNEVHLRSYHFIPVCHLKKHKCEGVHVFSSID